MKLQDIRQPKRQYNHKTGNKITIINFWQASAELSVTIRKKSKNTLKVGTAGTKELLIN